MSVEELIVLVRTECSLQLGINDLHTEFDDLEGWDWLCLLKLLSVLEAATGRGLAVTQLLEARCLADLHALVETAS